MNSHKAAAKELSNSIMAWIPLLPAWPLTQRAMLINYKLMAMYGYWEKDEGFVEDLS